jgi:hypothetical protein
VRSPKEKEKPSNSERAKNEKQAAMKEQEEEHDGESHCIKKTKRSVFSSAYVEETRCKC